MIPAERTHLHVAAVSHAGMSGKQNEDRYGVSAYYTDSTRRTPSVLAVIADGIGGHQAGEVAAELVVEVISQFVALSEATDPLGVLKNAVALANEAVRDKAESEPELIGMGSTVACAWVIGSRLYTAYVGDTRIYLVRGRSIHQLSTDHTWVQEALEQGALTPEEARNHPNAHIIRRYLGSRNGVIPDTRLKLDPQDSDQRAEANQGLLLQPGDVLLLCSDGLTDLVRNNEILASIQTRSAQEGISELVRLANQRGGHDNITVIALSVPAVYEATIPVEKRRSQQKRRRLPCLALTGILLLAVLAIAFAVWQLNRPVTAVMPSATPAPLQASLTPSLTISPVQVTASPIPATPSMAVETQQTLQTDFPTTNPGTMTPWPTNTLPVP